MIKSFMASAPIDSQGLQLREPVWKINPTCYTIRIVVSAGWLTSELFSNGHMVTVRTLEKLIIDTSILRSVLISYLPPAH